MLVTQTLSDVLTGDASCVRELLKRDASVHIVGSKGVYLNKKPHELVATSYGNHPLFRSLFSSLRPQQH